MSTTPISLLTLPDEVLLQIISTHLHMPTAEPRISLPKPTTEDPLAFTMTCRPLNQLVHVVEKDKVQPVTMFISRPINISDLLVQIKMNRVRRLTFTDIDFGEHVLGSEKEKEMRLQCWKQALLKLIGDLILAARSATACETIHQIKAIEFWPDTRTHLTAPTDETCTHRDLQKMGYERESESSGSTSIASVLFSPLATFATLLNIEFTLHTLQQTTDLIIISPLPPIINFIVPLAGIPVISSRLYSEVKGIPDRTCREDGH